MTRREQNRKVNQQREQRPPAPEPESAPEYEIERVIHHDDYVHEEIVTLLERMIKGQVVYAAIVGATVIAAAIVGFAGVWLMNS